MDLLKPRAALVSVVIHAALLGGIWTAAFLRADGESDAGVTIVQSPVAAADPLPEPPLPEAEPEPAPPPVDPPPPEPEPDLVEEPPADAPPRQPLLLDPAPSEERDRHPVPLAVKEEPAPADPEPPAAPTVEAEQEVPAFEDPVEDAESWVLDGPHPSYPRRAAARRMAGTVVLLVTVDATGVVAAVEVEQSSGHPILDRAAEEALVKWRFRIKEVAGRPQGYVARARIAFVLPGA